MIITLDQDYTIAVHIGDEYTAVAYGCRRVHSAAGTLQFVCPEDSFDYVCHATDDHMDSDAFPFASDDRYQIAIQVGRDPDRLFAVVIDRCGLVTNTSDTLVFRTYHATTAT